MFGPEDEFITGRLHRVRDHVETEISAVATVLPDKLVVYLFAAEGKGDAMQVPSADLGPVRRHNRRLLRPPPNHRECLGVSLPAL